MPDSRVLINMGVLLLEPGHAQNEVIYAYVGEDKTDHM
jgi:hypothetical protein